MIFFWNNYNAGPKVFFPIFWEDIMFFRKKEVSGQGQTGYFSMIMAGVIVMARSLEEKEALMQMGFVPVWFSEVSFHKKKAYAFFFMIIFLECISEYFLENFFYQIGAHVL